MTKYDMGENSETPRPTSRLLVGENVIIKTPDDRQWIYRRNGWTNVDGQDIGERREPKQDS